MASQIDNALMAGLSYQSTRDKINWFPVPSDWVEFSHVPNSTYPTTQGFEASAFRNATTGEIVISYAGTAELVDWVANLKLGLGFNAEQLNQAALYYLQIKTDNPSATISFTGHSLGGGLASLMGMFFDKKAVTFDQAPFASSASISVRDGLVTYLHDHGYSDIQLDALAPELLAFDGTSSRDTNITGKYVQGEALQGIPLLSTIGTQSMLSHNTVGSADAISLHSQALLAAYLQSDQTATTGKALDDATYKLPDLLKMIFDKDLYFNESDTDKENFLERLVKHEIFA